MSTARVRLPVPAWASVRSPKVVPLYMEHEGEKRYVGTVEMEVKPQYSVTVEVDGEAAEQVEYTPTPDGYIEVEFEVPERIAQSFSLPNLYVSLDRAPGSICNCVNRHTPGCISARNQPYSKYLSCCLGCPRCNADPDKPHEFVGYSWREKCSVCNLPRDDERHNRG